MICELFLFLYFQHKFSNVKALVKIDCLKSTKDLVDSLIIFPSNLLIVIFNWLCTEIYIILDIQQTESRKLSIMRTSVENDYQASRQVESENNIMHIRGIVKK